MCLQLRRICCGNSGSYFIYDFVLQEISERPLCNKDFESFYSKKIVVNIIPVDFVKNWLFFPYFFFRTKQKLRSAFQEVGGLLKKYISVFCLQRVVLHFKGMSNSINFYKGIFLHFIFFVYNSMMKINFLSSQVF